MKAVKVYVEGISDKLAMEQLLHPLIELQAQKGVSIQFFEAPSGDKKLSVMQKVPQRALHILRNEAQASVVAMPDLYPVNKGAPHETAEELEKLIQAEFAKVLKREGLEKDKRYLERFKVFCFKYELEALVLAAEAALALRLNTKQLKITWQKPVENQNKDYPPKKVLFDLFPSYGQYYSETADATLILGLSDYREIAAACPQCFAPFVQFLEQLSSTS